jgi:hypothetical protein
MSNDQINPNNLIPESTDMLVDFLGNSDKLVDSEKRWKFADHRNSPDSAALPNNQNYKDDHHHGHSDHDRGYEYDELDEGVDYISDKNKHDDYNYDKSDIDNHTYTDTDRDGGGHRQSFGSSEFDNQKSMTKEELMLAKLTMLRKLGELKQLGVKLSQNYGLDSDLKMMEYEYKLHNDIRAKQNSVQWMGHMLIGILKGSELLNDNFNPFDIKLDGLSTKVSSDMNTYYAVLGEIYEKYNQPGKQMAPEFKLLMMVSGAALSMQVNRALPGFMGGIANSVQNDDTVKNELRKKAASQSNPHENGGKNNSSGNSGQNAQSYNDEQHALAAKQIADIKFMQEKQLEYQRSLRQAEQARKTGGFILSSEQPDSEEHKEPEEKQYTPVQIEAIKRERAAREVNYLEALRKKAQINSHAYRTGSSLARNENQDSSRNQDLERQTKNLDAILGSLDDDSQDNRRSKNNHPERIVTKTKKLPKSKKTYASKNKHSDKRQSDNRSTFSSASSVSFNPKLDKLMNNTSKKKTNKLNKSKKSDEINYDNITRDSISVGSTDKKKKNVMVKFENLSDSSTALKVKSSKKSTRKSDKKSDTSSEEKGSDNMVDFGTMSFGSSKKGVTHTFNTGK